MSRPEKISKAVWIINSLMIVPGGLLAFSRLTYFFGNKIVNQGVTGVQFIAKKQDRSKK